MLKESGVEGGAVAPAGDPMADLVALRAEYLRSGRPAEGIRPVVVESWQRCREYGVDPQVLRRQVPDRAALEALRARHGELLRLAEPSLALMHTTLGNQPHLIALSDGEGRILRMLHSGIDVETCEYSNLFEGASWHERDIGCNGVGTCLATGRPVILLGPEHFQAAYVEWTCIGVPLRGCGEAIVGAIDLSVPNKHVHTHTWGWALSVAAAIEARLGRRESDLPTLGAELGAPLNASAGVLDLLGSQLGLSPTHARFFDEARRDISMASRQWYRTLRESENRFRTMADETPLMIWVTDASGGIEFINRAYGEFFGTTLAALQAREWQSLLHPEDHDLYMAKFHAALREQAPFRAQVRVRRADGQWRWIDSFGMPRISASGEFLGMAGSSPDVSEHKALEEALKEADRRKDEFLAMLGHELRNPLATLVTGLHLLREKPDCSCREQILTSLDRQAKLLRRLVDDLLDISRVTRGTIQLKSEVLDLAAVAEQAADAVAQGVAAAGHRFTFRRLEEPVWVMGDAARLQQVLVNLLSNAVKYTGEGGHIELAMAGDADSAIVRVKDNGLGIPAEMQKKIFDLFGQVDSSIHRPYQGLGIGLNLAKRIIHLHKGTIAVASEGAGKGSVFTLRLPRVAPPAQETAAGGRGATPGASPCLDVLIVEDNREAAEMLALVLREQGHRVRKAADGFEGVRMASERRPDLVILDIGLPGMDGYEVAGKLRTEVKLTEALLVAATGYGQEKDRQRSRAAGIDHHLVKPLEYEALAVLIRQWQQAHRRIVSDETAPNGHPPPANPLTGQRKRILVIEDLRPLAQMTRELLAERGHEVRIAYDGPGGVLAAKEFRPEVILCDIGLPGMDGYEVAAAVRADPKLESTTLVAVTGHAEETEKRRALESGFHTHLVKPIHPETIARLIEDD